MDFDGCRVWAKFRGRSTGQKVVKWPEAAPAHNVPTDVRLHYTSFSPGFRAFSRLFCGPLTVSPLCAAPCIRLLQIRAQGTPRGAFYHRNALGGHTHTHSHLVHRTRGRYMRFWVYFSGFLVVAGAVRVLEGKYVRICGVGASLPPAEPHIPSGRWCFALRCGLFRARFQPPHTPSVAVHHAIRFHTQFCTRWCALCRPKPHGWASKAAGQWPRPRLRPILRGR